MRMVIFVEYFSEAVEKIMLKKRKKKFLCISNSLKMDCFSCLSLCVFSAVYAFICGIGNALRVFTMSRSCALMFLRDDHLVILWFFFVLFISVHFKFYKNR